MRSIDPHEKLLDQIAAEARATAHLTERARFSPQVMAAMRAGSCDAFVPPEARSLAYDDRPLAIGCGQTISQPFIVALMTDLLDLQPGDRVLEVGTGSGYQTAVLAQLAADVCSIEVVPALAQRAATVLADQGCGSVALRVGDGGKGWPERAPFDAIIVTAAAPVVPPALVEQLAPGGRLVIPVGAASGDQVLRLITRGSDGAVQERDVLSVAFVPLVPGRPPEKDRDGA